MLKRRVMPRLRPRPLAQNCGARQGYLATPPSPSADVAQKKVLSVWCKQCPARSYRLLSEGSAATALNVCTSPQRTPRSTLQTLAKG